MQSVLTCIVGYIVIDDVPCSREEQITNVVANKAGYAKNISGTIKFYF